MQFLPNNYPKPYLIYVNHAKYTTGARGARSFLLPVARSLTALRRSRRLLEHPSAPVQLTRKLSKLVQSAFYGSFAHAFWPKPFHLHVVQPFGHRGAIVALWKLS